MPRGSYLVDGRPEAFSCAPGPAGWRYVSDVLDLACDRAFGAVRFEVRSGGSWARGGRTSLDDGRRVLVWACSSDPGHERLSGAGALVGRSPGLLVALLRSVSEPGSDPVRATVRVVQFEEPALAGLDATRVLARGGAQTHVAPAGDLLVEEWTVDDPDTGARVVVHLAGDVVLAAEGPGAGVELTALESPPTARGGVDRTGA